MQTQGKEGSMQCSEALKSNKSDDLTANTRVPVVPFGLAYSAFLGEKV
jgi:hypothetical protein